VAVGLQPADDLFDVDIPDGVTYRESDSVAPGDRFVTCDVDDWKVGLSICYDLRFPSCTAVSPWPERT
jgi:omega-amidase